MENILFRYARSADWKKIATISQELGKFQKDGRPNCEPAVLDSMSSRSRPLFWCVVAEEKSQIIGHLSYTITYAPYCSRTVYVNAGFVDPQARKKTLGWHIMNWLLNDALQYKWKQGHAFLYKWNQPSKHLMEKFGWQNTTDAHGYSERFLPTLQVEAFSNPKLTYALVRLATKEDCKQIANLVKSSKNQKLSLNTDHITEQQLQEDGFGTFPFYQALVVEDTQLKEKGVKDSIVGCSIFTEVFTFFYGRTLHLAGLYVKSEYDNDRLDMKLWSSLAQLCKAKECRGIVFTSGSENNSCKYANELEAYDYAMNSDCDNYVFPINTFLKI